MAKEKRPSVKTPLFRGSFVNLAKPRKVSDDSDKEQYSMLIPLPKDKPATKAFIKELLALIQSASDAKHGAGFERKKLKYFPVKDGDGPDYEDNEQFNGHWLIRCASNFKPSAIDIHGDELLTADELYSGAWYKAKLSVWAWANPKGGKGVSINLDSVIKMKDDTRFGGGSNASEDFAEDITGGDKEEEDIL
jgi:hypothetical protein